MVAASRRERRLPGSADLADIASKIDAADNQHEQSKGKQQQASQEPNRKETC
jgi:hypothetical protein